MRQQDAAAALSEQSSAFRGRQGAPELPVVRPEGKADGPRAHRRDVLTRTIESEVIPRLLRAHGADPDRRDPADERALQPRHDDIRRLVDLVLWEEPPAAVGFVQAMRDTGMSFESLYLDLLTPTARSLGVMWEEDVCDFTDVTVGLMRLHHVMRGLAPAFIGAPEPDEDAPLALLVQMPGEQHGFGLAMVTQFFLRAGWRVAAETTVTSADLIRLVRERHYALVGISVASSDSIAQLAVEIRAIREAALNREIRIMVGGQPFVAQPQLSSIVGADATAIDGLDAVAQANALIAGKCRPRLTSHSDGSK